MKEKCRKNGGLFIQMGVVVLLAVSTFSGSAKAAAVAKWDFEDNLTDSCSGHNGTDFGFTGYDVYSDLGINATKALILIRERKQHVIVPDSADLRPENFTIMVWARVMGSQDTNRVLINKLEHDKKAGYILYARADNKWVFGVSGSDGLHTIIGSDVVRGQWVHLAATFEKTGRYDDNEIIGTMKFYADGTMVGSKSGVRYNPDSSPINFVIGSDWSRDAGFFNKFAGRLDEVQFHDNVFDASAIKSVYDSDAVTVEIMTYNTLYGGIKGNPKIVPPPFGYEGRTDVLIDCIKKYGPDVLLMQECSRWAIPSNPTLRNFSEQLEMPYVQIANEEKNLGPGEYMHWAKIVTLSKYPKMNDYNLPDNVDFWENIIRTEVQVTSTRKIGIVNLHFAWWSHPDWKRPFNDDTPENRATYKKMRDYLMGDDWIGWALSRDFPCIVGGDWNHHLSQTFLPSDKNEKPTSPTGYFGQQNLHDELRATSFGLDQLRRFNGMGADPIDTFYVNDPHGKITVIGCEKNREFQRVSHASDHPPTIMKLLVW